MLTVYENATELVLTGEAEELRLLVEETRFRPENYFYAVSYQRYVKSRGTEGWDGYIRPVFPINATSAKALRGHREHILRLADMLNLEVNRKHLLPRPFAELMPDDVAPDLIAGPHQLDDNQRRCICDWLREGIGFNKITVGGGKTATFAGAAALIKQHFPEARFLYLTPSERLVRQSTHDMRGFLPQFEIGQCGGGVAELEARDMVVCTVALLHRRFRKLKTEGWFDTFMAVLYDEVHHTTSDTSQQVIMSVPAYFRLGASDTAKQEDMALKIKLRGLFGDMLNDIKASPLIASGRLAQPHIYIVDQPGWEGARAGIDFRACVGSTAYLLLDQRWVKARYAGPVYELDKHGEVVKKIVHTSEQDAAGNWIVDVKPVTVPGLHTLEIDGVRHEVESRWCLLDRTYDKAVIQFKPRNDLIIQWASFFSQRGWPTVIVATRTTHVYILEALLKPVLQEKLDILTGEDNSQRRDDVFQWLRDTPGAVLITPLVREGVSINEIRAVIVADYVSDYEVARQIIGRAMRPKKRGSNQAHVVWFWDKQHPQLKRSCHNLFSRLRKMDGYVFHHACGAPETVFPPDSGSIPA